MLLLLGRAGRPPWIALALVTTFGAYGLLRNKSPLGPLVGLGLETLVFTPVALGFCFGGGARGRVLLFAYGARRLRLATLGLLQYIAPTAQFAVGAGIYRETLSPGRLTAFGLIWCGLGLYTADNLWRARRATRPESRSVP